MSEVVDAFAASVGVHSYSVEGGTITLDATSSPYASASIVIARPASTAAIAALNARQSPPPRIRITAIGEGGTVVHDLSIRESQVSHDATTITIEAASDEALAEDWAPTTDDGTPFMVASSMRAVVDAVLGRVGGVRRNLHPFPTAGIGSGWGGNPGTGGAWTTSRTPLIPSAALPWSPMRGFTASWTAPASSMATVWSQRFPIPIEWGFTASVYAQSTVAGATYRVVISWLNSSNAVISQSFGDWSASGARRTVTGERPAGATQADVWLQVQGTIVTGSFLWVTGMQFEAGAEVTPFAENVLAAPLYGVPDADLSPIWPLTNLIPNPCLGGIVGTWIAGGTNGVLTRATSIPAGLAAAGGPSGVTTGTLTTWTGNSGGGQGGAFLQSATLVPYVPVRPNTVYTVSTWARASAAKSVRLAVQEFGADGSVLQPGLTVTTENLPAGGWVRVIGTIKTGALAARLGPFLYAAPGSQWTSGQTLHTTAWMLHEGAYPVHPAFFDGSTPSDALYSYAALGAAHVSATTRTPLGVERSPDALVWKAGQPAIEFLAPLLQARGQRLVCSSGREWTLRTAAGIGTHPYELAERGNLTSNDVTISRDEGWFDARTTVYSWTDPQGNRHEVTDAYGVAGYSKMSRLELSSPYPGPGRSQYAVSRARTRGRVAEAELRSVYDWEAGRNAIVRLLGMDDLYGVTSAVRFDIDSGRMTVTIRPEEDPFIPPAEPGVPGAPASATFTAVGGGSATAHWVAPDTGGSPILEYQVQARAWDPERGYSESVGLALSTTFYGTGYHRFNVRARNAFGWGPWSPGGFVTIPA